MVWRKTDGHTYYCRVVTPDRRTRVCSCETPLKTTAKAMESWVKGIRGRHDPHGILAAIVDGRVSLAVAYRQGEDATKAALEAAAVAAADVDLKPLLAEWMTWRRQRARGQSMVARYEAQLRVLWPEATWPRSQWTARELTRRLDALVVKKDATRNRYRAAVSAFSKWLVTRKGLLTHNPVHQIEGYGESRPQEIWYSEADARRVLLALPGSLRARELLMAGCGMDWSDCARLRRRDLDLDARTVRCHGSKTVHRNREIRITERWVVALLRPLVAGMLPDALVCAPVRPAVALKAHRAALAACEVPDSTLHNWRHHYAVTLLKRGERPQVVAAQLGKTNVKDVLDRYGKYVPRLADYLPEAATDSATADEQERTA